MAANDEFPRGQLVSSGITGLGGQASITFPASPGITWTLTTANLQFFWNAAGGAPGTGVFMQIITSAGTTNYGLAAPPAGSGQGATEEYDLPAEVSAPLGSALTVQANAGVGNFQQALVASAYPS